MDRVTRFARVTSGNIMPNDTLDVGRRYPVTHARRQESQYRPSILLILSVDPTNDVKVYLLKRFMDVFQDIDIELINAATRSFHLVYHGRYPNGRSYKLTLEN